MAKTARIKAAQGSSYLEFSHSDDEYFSVTFKAETLEAAVRVWAYTDAQWLVTIFQDMEAHWKGWDGVKEWKAVEGEFGIQFTSDKLGHIFINVHLKPESSVGCHWEVQGGFYFEAGQLPTLTRQISEFFSASS